MYFMKTAQSRHLDSKGRYNEGRRAPTERSAEQGDPCGLTSNPPTFSSSVAEPRKACLVLGDV